MKYLIIGAGAEGGCLAGFMLAGGMDVSVIDQGEQLDAIKKNGITVETEFRGTFTVHPTKVCSTHEYHDKPDVIILCVKDYSLEALIPYLSRHFVPGTIILPMVSVFGTGIRLQTQLPEFNVLESFSSLAAIKTKPGVVRMLGNIFSIVFGVRELEMYTRYIDKISFDFRCCDIEAYVSDEILPDTLRKFSFVSSISACGLYYNCTVGKMQKDGEERETVIKLSQEIEKLGTAMGYRLAVDFVESNLELLDRILPDAFTSLQRDIEAGRPSEMEGIVLSVPVLGRQYGVELPTYEKIANEIVKR